jgi:hypothetical protein
MVRMVRVVCPGLYHYDGQRNTLHALGIIVFLLRPKGESWKSKSRVECITRFCR